MRYVFGDYELDTQTYELCRAGKPLKIEPQVFKVLAYLIQHHQRTVTRQELLEHLWPDPFTSEAVLSYCIMTARKAIGDSGRAQQVIKTIHGRGFRFVAMLQQGTTQPVDSETAAAPETSTSTLPPVSRHNSTLDSQHMQITVLCATLVNATTLEEQLGFAALQRLRQAFFALAQDQAQQYEGLLQFFGADGILVLFGAPIACEDHARRAVLTAREIQQRLGAYQTDATVWQTLQQSIRIGLHTGPVDPDSIPSDRRISPTEMGETTHLALWLQYLADAGTILISEATIQEAQAEDLHATPRKVQIPGQSQPMRAYTIRR
jgi:DNA-binding winged helix-turn-helix (wHTH) protein